VACKHISRWCFKLDTLHFVCHYCFTNTRCSVAANLRNTMQDNDGIPAA